MVRHGMLSKGCETCRKRKIKCDQSLPSCSQCRKAGWKCPQYGDSLERMFQYQGPEHFKRTKKVAARVGVQGLPEYTTTSSSHKDNASTDQVSFGTLPKEITQSVNDRAIEYFLLTHTFREDGRLRGFHEYLLAPDGIRTDKAIFTSLSAAALAAYGNTFRHFEILREGRSYYGQALRLVNSALQSSAEAARNSTMVSILLLNTFEAITSEGQRSLAYSDGHMRGVMMIMNLRGRSLMDTRQGLQVFLHMCRCLIAYCVIRPARLPTELIQLRRHAAMYLDPSTPSWRLEEMMAKLAEFRADVKAGVLAEPRWILDHALQLDHEFFSLFDDMPTQWDYETIHLKGKPELGLSTYYHVYPDLWVAYIWNYIRTCRLILHKEIQEQLTILLAGSYSHQLTDLLKLHQQSNRTLDRMISDICASVPQYSGRVVAHKIAQHAEGVVAFGEHTSSSVPTTAGAYFLLWPLMTSGALTKSTEQRDWIISRSRDIGYSTGIRRAFIIADAIQSGKDAFL